MSIDKNTLKTQAQGRWLEILQYVCPGLFDDAIENLGKHVRCPFHGGEADFRLVKKAKSGKQNTAECGIALCTCGVFHDGFAVIQEATGMTFFEACKEVDEYLNGNSSSSAARAIQAAQPKFVEISAEEQAELDAKILDRVYNLWSAAQPLDHKYSAYYRARGMSQVTIEALEDVRYIPSLGYFDAKGVRQGAYPALLALMRNSLGKPVAIHRTWLSVDLQKKAPVLKAKKLTQTPGVQGAAIRLFDAEGATTLGLTEGIETAQAAWQLAHIGHWADLETMPVWPCFAERNLRSFEIPMYLLETLKKIVIFADNDENGKGMEAAMAFKVRMTLEQPGIEVVVKLPTVIGWDWNDALLNLAS